MNNIFKPYLDDLNPEHWVDTFPSLMWSMGYEMDCYNSYNKLFPEPISNSLPQVEIEDIILNNLKKCDAKIVGNYIFSRYRELTHWCDYGYPIERSDYFFPKAFEILSQKINNDN